MLYAQPVPTRVVLRISWCSQQKVKLLFVCVENSNRSQMSHAFAKILGGDAVEVRMRP